MAAATLAVMAATSSAASLAFITLWR